MTFKNTCERRRPLTCMTFKVCKYLSETQTDKHADKHTDRQKGGRKGEEEGMGAWYRDYGVKGGDGLGVRWG